MKANWFVAIPVSAGPWFDAFIAKLPDTCRPFHASDLHLTLAFLGAMNPAKQPQIIERMQRIQAQPITVSFADFLPLPSSKRLSALTLSLSQGHDDVADLMRQHRDDLLAIAGARSDDREPLPHATFARPIRKFGHQGRQAALTWLAEQSVPQVALQLDRVALYTWSDQRPRIQFRIVHEKKLFQP